VSFSMSCGGSTCGVRRIRVAQGEWRYRNVQGDARRCPIDAREFMRSTHISERAKPRTRPLSRSKPHRPLMPPAWVNFLRQRLHVLHLDCKHVGAGRIVVRSTPHAAESVARLVLSAMQCADHYFQTAVRNR
jgi:hypothetical protein